MSHIVFLTVFLGLSSGVNPVEVRVDDAVKSVRLLLNGKEVAALSKPPWIALIDFGAAIQPARLEAVALDKDGDEIDRVSQILNLERPLAEAQIVVHEHDGLPASVDVIGHHLQFYKAVRATVRVDDVKVRVDRMAARLPQLDWRHSHVVAAELKFEDGTVARTEIVLNGGYSDSVGSQLSPVLIAPAPAKLDRVKQCVFANGEQLRVSAVEKPAALVVFVLDPDPQEAEKTFRIWRQVSDSPMLRDMLRQQTTLGSHTLARITWPTTVTFSDQNNTSSILFDHTNDFEANKRGLAWLLTQREVVNDAQPRQFADAVAVAALQTMAPPRPRAVVYVVTNTRDQSLHTPAQVRPYLESIHVPLFVWSPSRPRPDLASSWGEVSDISTAEKLRDATQRLRETIDAQAIAWVATDPLTALHAGLQPGCAK